MLNAAKAAKLQSEARLELAKANYRRAEKLVNSNAGSRRSSRDVKNPVLMRTIGESGYQHKGHMDFVDNRLDDNTGTIRGRAIFANPNLELTPGQFGDIVIPGSGVIEARLIPDTAILADQSKRFVYVIDGLTPDTRVAISNLQMLRQGADVQVDEDVIEATGEDGLPDSYKPVPESEWSSRGRNKGASSDTPDARRQGNNKQRSWARQGSEPASNVAGPARVQSRQAT